MKSKKIEVEDFDLFIKSIEMIYGKNYFIEYDSKEFIKIHLYFDEITIKNSAKKQHQIKDLFIVIGFPYDYDKKNYTLSHGLKGYRTFITQNEADVSYLHSHLSSTGEFCLGSGPLDSFMNKNAYSLNISKSNIIPPGICGAIA